MTPSITFACLVVFIATNVNAVLLPQRAQNKVADFSFAGASYFHRYTNADQHEFTPAGQENLNIWTDMVTLLFYRTVKDGEGLAATANSVLENYKANKAIVAKTDSVPRTKDRPAEHLIVVIFGRPEFIEVAFSRFKMSGGIGSAVVYSHRIYGNKVGDQMSAWLQREGPTREKELMSWDAIPKRFLSN